MPQSFNAKIQVIGINPYVLVPPAVLKEIFAAAGKNKGPIPVKGTINKHSYIQTLVKYSGKWRLYINGLMLKDAKASPGDKVDISILFDATERITPMHPALKLALQKNKTAQAVFKKLPPSRQKEIKRYINNLKTTASIEKNIDKAIMFLTGISAFAGREKP